MPVSIDFSGKGAFITGGARGLGRDIVKRFAEAGANVAFTYNSTEPAGFAEEVAAQYKVTVKAYKMPAADSSVVDSVVKQATADLGPIDYVVCNAGICIHRDADQHTDEDFLNTFQVNTFNPFYVSRAFYKVWQSEKDINKSIVFVSSMSATVYNFPQNQCAYNPSKAALTMLAKSLAGEWATKGIRVNSCSPGYIATEMSIGAKGAGDWASIWEEHTPMKRFAQPKEIADQVLVMSSGLSSFMTGSDVIVDGGYTIY